jgi:hypothetical protein
MTDHEQIEDQICELLGTETSGIRLSNKLFAPDGLFPRLADTEEERRIVARSLLFREALKRLSELQKTEFAEFTRTVRRFEEMSIRGNNDELRP